MARWVRISSSFFRDPKIRKLSLDAKTLFVASLCYCSEQMTDGIVDDSMLRLLAAEVDVDPDPEIPKSIGDAGLWERHQDVGWRVLRFLDYNPSREEELNRLEASRERAARFRARRKSESDVTRDTARDATRKKRVSNTTTIRNEKSSSSSSGVTNTGVTNAFVTPFGERVVDQEEEEEEKESINHALRILAERDATRYADHGGRISNRNRFIAKCISTRREIHGVELNKLHQDHPNWDAKRLAETVEPTRPPGKEDCPLCGELFAGRHICSSLDGGIFDPADEGEE